MLPATHCARGRSATADLPAQQHFVQHAQRRRSRAAPRRVGLGRARGSEVCSAASSSTQQLEAGAPAICSRRAALPAIGLALFSSVLPPQPADAAEPSGGPTPEFITYSNESLRYSLIRPANWEAVSDIGADAVFEDPDQRSIRVGVTVYNVSISSLEEFGGLEDVGQVLLSAEQLKDGTQDVQMLWQQQRSFDDRDYYNYAYLLDTTRGRWQIFSSVAVRGRALFILDASMGCGRAAGAACSPATAELLKQVAESFRVL